MYFADYLKVVARSHGPESLGSPTAIDHLLQMGAFSGAPALLSAYRMAVTSHSLRHFIEAGVWDDDSARLVERFVVHSGLRPELVHFLFQSVGAAAGMAVSVPQENASVSAVGDEAHEPAAVYGAGKADEHWAINPRWHRLLDFKDKLDFISSLLEVDREREPIVGLGVEKVACIDVSESVVTVTFQLRRLAPGATGVLNYAVYDVAGHISDIGMAAAVTVDSACRTPHKLRIVTRPGRVAKILLYWAE